MPLHSQSDEVEWLHRHNPFNLLSVRDRINLNLSFEIFRRLDYRVPIASSTSMQINILYLAFFFLQQKDNCISQPGSLLCCFLSTVCRLQFGSENIVKKLLLGELQGMTNNFAFMFWGPWAPYLTARVGCTLLLCCCGYSESTSTNGFQSSGNLPWEFLKSILRHNPHFLNSSSSLSNLHFSSVPI